MTREVVVVSGVRTAIGTFGGALKDTPTVDLGALVVKEALARAGVEGKDVGHVVFGHVVNTEPRDMYLSRVAAINGGCQKETPAMNVNRLCGSGLQAIVSASQGILLGDYDIAIGGGAENMSRAPYASLATRFGARMGDSKMVDMMVGALHDPFHTIHMGVTAENVAAEHGITREMQDALALESHRRAEVAWAEGRFKDQIVPVMLKSRKGEVAFDKDEHFRPGAMLEDFQKMKAVFLKENGTVTAGNASGINDAAAAVLLMEANIEEPLTLADVAAVFNFSPNYLSQLFGKYGDSGFVEYITETRIAAAKEMLEQGDLKVYEIAEKLGYESAFYFSKVFKKVTGLSPREYQQSI